MRRGDYRGCPAIQNFGTKKAKVLSIAHGLTGRVKCDYNIEVVFDEGEIGELLNEAEHFD